MAERGDRHRGAVKLNKIVWWADQESYRRGGYSITGSDYQRLPQGPVPHRLDLIRQQLARGARVTIGHRDVGAPNPAIVLEPGPSSDMSEVRRLLDEDDVAMLEEALAKFHNWTGTQVSEFSHRESIAWKNLEDGDLIPDSAWLIDTRSVATDFDVKKLLNDSGFPT